MIIAILGAGNVGRALGSRLTVASHQIVYGVRNPEDSRHDALKILNSSTVASFADAANSAPILILATPWRATRDVLNQCGNLNGKTLVDCTNPIREDFTGLEFGQDTSAAEKIAGWVPGAIVVKCFNQTGADNLGSPEYGPDRPVMFIAGDDKGSVTIVAGLARDVGFDAVTVTGLRMARQLEQLAWLWIDLASKEGMGRNFAFHLLRR